MGTSTTFKPTDEQTQAVDLARSGADMAIQALAGTGKTSTLRMISETLNGQGAYLAFNRSTKDSASETFPANTRCSTAHGIARGAVGFDWVGNRMAQTERVSNSAMAEMLGLDPEVDVVFGDGQTTVTLDPGVVAGIAARTVGKFCQTDALEIGRRHVPFQRGLDRPGSGRDNFNALVDLVVPLARKMWDNLADPGRDTSYRFGHNHYLKIWQLSDPVIRRDFILFDECQPPDTLVALAGGRGQKRIVDLVAGDRVVSYTKGRVLSEKFGSVVEGKSVNQFVGVLVVVSDGENTSRYTPNHICMAKMGGAFEGKHLLYLMRHADGRHRIGVTKARHGNGSTRQFGLTGRLREEGGEAVWILGMFADRREALASEQLVSLEYRIPQTRFETTWADGRRGDPMAHAKFWEGWDVGLSDVAGCLRKFGRDERYPILSNRRYMLADRFTEIRAANIMPGFEMMDADMDLKPIDTWREPYSGPVVSLDVSGPATYVADGIVTHNCQDANPVMMSIVENQGHAQRIWVGDENQTIYGWNGAVNAMALADVDATCSLTRSFRFGPEIAEVANIVLARLGPDRLIGAGAPGRVGVAESPDVLLARKNITIVARAFEDMERGLKVCIQGGAGQIIKIAKAARRLKSGRRTDHPELACFKDWEEVEKYAGSDDGVDLRPTVALINKFGVEDIIRGLAATVKAPGDADVLLSTAHRSKGGEWPAVELLGDFPEGDNVGDDELRLMYVAATRAQHALDRSMVDLEGIELGLPDRLFEL